MLRRGSILFLLFAVIVQAMPLRACAVEQAVLGESCHGTVDGNDGGRALTFGDGGAGHATGALPCDTDCPCEMPKGQLDRHVPADEAADLVPAAVLPLDLGLSPIPVFVTSVVDRPPRGVLAAVILPLLI